MRRLQKTLNLEAGIKVLHKSATIRHALKAQEAGVDLIEIVGYEGLKVDSRKCWCRLHRWWPAWG